MDVSGLTPSKLANDNAGGDDGPPRMVTVVHRAKPGRRADVQAVWSRLMPEAVTANPGHLAYFYSLDETDSDVIRAVQIYRSAASAQAFLHTEAYRAYAHEVEPLLVHPPDVAVSTVVWGKT